MKNKNCIFAASIPQTIFLAFVCVAIFIATYSAVNAANIGYQFPVDCCTAKSVIVCGRTGGDSLSFINTLIFHSQMPQTMKNASKVNNSTLTSTPDCESVTPKEKQFDFSKLNKYLTDVIYPSSVAEDLRAITISYLEMSLYTLMEFEGMRPLKMCPHEDVQDHIIPSRRSSCSTRTAHPHYLTKIVDFISKLGLNHLIRNEYEMKTKGEMLENCNDKDMLLATYQHSCSCAKRGHKVHWDVRTAPQCGACMPCIYRRV
jgi:hypothetical protein